MTEQQFKVAEIFGPTLQGEGPSAGKPVMFVRFGGCDYRCGWCDSMHAVDPSKVKLLPAMPSEQIVERLEQTCKGFKSVVFSGGNPLIWDLTPLVHALRQRGWWIAVETQGTVYRPWLTLVNEIVLSPKPPSSGMDQSPETVQKFMALLLKDTAVISSWKSVDLKIVIFTPGDLEYAYEMAQRLSARKLYLSVGTYPEDTTEDILGRMLDIWVLVQEAKEQEHSAFPVDVRIAPQMHVLLWGHKLGV